MGWCGLGEIGYDRVTTFHIDGLRKAGDAPGHKIVVAVCVCILLLLSSSSSSSSC